MLTRARPSLPATFASWPGLSARLSTRAGSSVTRKPAARSAALAGAAAVTSSRTALRPLASEAYSPAMLTPLAASAEVILAKVPGRFSTHTVICLTAIGPSCGVHLQGPSPQKTRLWYQIGETSLRNSRSRRFVWATPFRYDRGCAQTVRSHSQNSRGKEIQGGIMPIAVGQPAPEFALKDQNQQEVKLADFKGKKNVVMVFYPLDWSRSEE